MMFADTKPVPENLTLSQKADGRKSYRTFSLLNGVSIVCLAQNMLILYCLKCGASDALTGIIASFVYLATFFMLFGKKLVRAIGAARTIKYCWITRNTFAMLLLAVPFVSRALSPFLGLTLIAICAFGFFASRAAGMIGMQPLIGEIVSDDNRGKFLSSIFLNFCLSNIVFMGLIILLFSHSKSIHSFQLIIFTGALAGYISTFFIGRIRESRIPRLSASQSLRDVVAKVSRKKRYVKLLFAHCFATSGTILVVPFSMMALKTGYGVDDQTALLFAMVQMVGGFSVSYLNGILSEETGPRPLLIIYFSLLLGIVGLWCLAPTEFVWYYFIPVFFLTGLSATGILLTLGHYFIVSIPPGEMVGVSLLIVASSGVITGLTGTVIGGGMMKILHHCVGGDGITTFKIYFLVIALILISYFFFITRLERIKDWNTGKVISLIFAPRDLKTLFLLYHLEGVSTPDKELETIDKLESSKSELSEKKLLESMKSPKFTMRAKAMTALQQIPFGEDSEAANALMDELENGQYSTAYIAAQTLGERRITKAVPLLEKSLGSDDPYLQSKCMIALVQLQAEHTYEQIKQIFINTDNPGLIIHGANALLEMKDPGGFPLLLEKLRQQNIPSQVVHETIYCVSEMLGVGDDYYKFLKMFHDDRQKASAFAVDLLESSGSASKERERLIHDVENYILDPDNVEVKTELMMEVKPHVQGNRLLRELFEHCQSNIDKNENHPELLFCLIFSF